MTKQKLRYLFWISLVLHYLCSYMAGLYIHIPFCRSRCIYCGFYSTTMLGLREEYVDALCKEMRMRGHAVLDTIYLGGGTPSLLTRQMLGQLFDTIETVYDVRPGAEITMECNPDDVDAHFAEMLHSLPVNRVSMGIQSFDEERLKFLHRRHTAQQGRHAVDLLREAGINNISIDLMFGFPNETLEQWRYDINQALLLKVEHISAYSLMVEENTPLYRMVESQMVKEADDDTYIIMYNQLVKLLKEAGYQHYEISNFALPGYHSRHNSSYWNDIPYIGIGAAAHSYDVTSRSSNVADVKLYIHSIKSGVLPSERENLSKTDRYNDMITTRLRTCRGICLGNAASMFGEPMIEYLLQNAQPYLDSGWLVLEDGHLHLTHKGIMMSDTVMGDLIKID